VRIHFDEQSKKGMFLSTTNLALKKGAGMGGEGKGEKSRKK